MNVLVAEGFTYMDANLMVSTLTQVQLNGVRDSARKHREYERLMHVFDIAEGGRFAKGSIEWKDGHLHYNKWMEKKMERLFPELKAKKTTVFQRRKEQRELKHKLNKKKTAFGKFQGRLV